MTMRSDTYGSTAGAQAGNWTVTAFFDDRVDAEAAIEELVTEGVDRSSIVMVSGGGTTPAPEDKGFWESLKDLFLPDDDRALYSEGLRRGGYLVTVTASAANYSRVMEILDDEGTIDIGQRAETWRSEGWSDTADLAPAASTAAGYADRSVRTGTSDEEIIPVAEEELHVGKRDVSHGRVRVRSYVVETPVTETVDLAEEHVDVQRRAVNRPLTDADALFQDKTIEVEERAEEAVVAKEARVTEEVVVRKGVEHRTDTVSDTVRKTRVEVEDDRRKH